MDKYLKETEKQDKKIIAIFEKFYAPILFEMRVGSRFTDGEEYLLNEYISATDRQSRREKYYDEIIEKRQKRA